MGGVKSNLGFTSFDFYFSLNKMHGKKIGEKMGGKGKLISEQCKSADQCQLFSVQLIWSHCRLKHRWVN